MLKLNKTLILSLVVIILGAVGYSNSYAGTDYYSGSGWLGGDREVRGHYVSSSQDSQTGTVAIQCDLVLSEICFTVSGPWIHTLISSPPQGQVVNHFVQPNP